MRSRSLLTRWLGVGLASCLAVTTLTLWGSGRLALYVNPDSAWFVVGMSVLLLIGAAASFTLPLGAEADHGHDHGDIRAPDPGHAAAAPALAPTAPGATARHAVAPDAARDTARHWASHADDGATAARAERGQRAERGVGGVGGVGTAAVAFGGVLASGVVVTMLVVPPASLSAELAMSRDVGAPPLFAGADVVTLASSGDTSEFGLGDWASVFATTNNPDTFDGDPITLTGFVTPGEDGAFDLTRLVITHCVIDAQPASLPITATADAPDTGQWVTVTGTVRSTSAGGLEVRADEVRAIDEPADPYEY